MILKNLRDKSVKLMNKKIGDILILMEQNYFTSIFNKH